MTMALRLPAKCGWRVLLVVALNFAALIGGGSNAALAAPDAPGWKILVLIYTATEVTVSDATGSHHVVAEMTATERALAADASTAFVLRDIPALDSRQMIPSREIRYPGMLTDLDGFCGWWPSPRVTAAALDPTFDSVIVIWDSSGTDTTTGAAFNLQNCGGLTLPNGTGQTYSTFQIDSVHSNSRNVFRHEWGHAITFYYDAAGTAPKPMVDNHHPEQYVHCETTRSYVLTDETTDHPIPNSIYNLHSGFTHDYYSGKTALVSAPDTCLGITRKAWLSGGPVSKPFASPR